jgi:glycerol-3-phosphate dehydrogenase (NAD(P)+)
MPICEAVDAIVTGGADVDETIAGLLARPFRDEGL